MSKGNGKSQTGLQFDIPDDFVVPPCTLPEDDLLRSHIVVITRLEDQEAWDIRVSCPLQMILRDSNLPGGAPKWANAVSVNAGKILTQQMWNQILPLLKEKLEALDNDSEG